MGLSDSELHVLGFLEQCVTPHKRSIIDHVLKARTRYISIVLEDIYQSQNASAAVRTCECFGVQDIHVIENKNSFAVNTKVLRGSNKWVTITRYRKRNNKNTKECVALLRSRGYQIVATDPSPDGLPLQDLDISRSPMALFFGNELEGLSSEVLDQSDLQVRIPMFGFTESLNISASVSACLMVLMQKLRSSTIHYFLTQSEQQALRLEWYRSIVRRSSDLEKAYLKTIR